MSVLATVFWGVVTFSILVVIHEGGHLLAARAFGIKVHEFMIGLPGPALRIRTKNMAWGVTAVPLGGYVRIAGMEPGPEDELLAPALEHVCVRGRADATSLSAALGIDTAHAAALLATLADWAAIAPASDDEASYVPLAPLPEDGGAPALLAAARARTFRGAATWKRIVVLAAGVTVNLLAALLTFTIVLTAFGYYEPVPVIAKVLADTPAAAAGLHVGDRIERIDGVRVTSWTAFTTRVAARKPGATVTLQVRRGAGTLALTAKLAEHGGGGYLGIAPSARHIRPGILKAIGDSFGYVGEVFKAIGGFFQPSTFQTSVEHSAGIVGISVMAAQAAKAGPLDYAFLIALLSLSLGAMNILPIPPLDGGKIALEIVERALGRPLSRRVSIALSVAGTTLLFGFIAYIMYADIARLVR